MKLTSASASAGDGVEVGPYSGHSQISHHVDEKPGVHPIRVARVELTTLDGDQCRLAAADGARCIRAAATAVRRGVYRPN
jgi:hypothetical protein